jgi:DNA-binding response OmpR family regulator
VNLSVDREKQVMGPILIIEDDPNTSNLVKTYLEREGYSTLVASDGALGLEMARKYQPAFVILDIMLPEIDGWEICKKLRQDSDVPILMLTAREEEIDRVLGLTLGADDYVVKPFSPRELVERVKAILRRTLGASVSNTRTLSHSGITLDPEKYKVTKEGKQVNLTTSEYKLLLTLMSSPGRVFSREELLERFYGHGEVVIDRVIDVHIGKLRQKVEVDPTTPRLIITVRGFGYRFADGDES